MDPRSMIRSGWRDHVSKMNRVKWGSSTPCVSVVNPVGSGMLRFLNLAEISERDISVPLSCLF